MKSNAVLPDVALREALGQVIANERREWRRERELIEAQSREAIADLRAKIVELEASAREALSARLATLKDGIDGKDADPEVIERMVAEAVSRIPAPKDGIDGKDGRDGLDGLPGRDGVDGKDGAPGANGEPGRDGRDGVDGSAGRDGERGPEGPPGKLPIVREWSEGVHYEGETVSHLGSTYQALRDTGRAPPNEDWHCIASAGRDGMDGRSFRIRGTWAEGESYQALDVVALGGASFAARRDEPGACPGDGWQLIAAQGKRGNPGERGASGKTGERGNAGPPAIAADVDDQGMLTITNGDGSTVTCDLYPLLSRLQR